MDNDDFYSGAWRLYLVNEHEGNNPDHYFYKFVAIPTGCRGNGKRSCLKRGWEHVGDFNADTASQDLEDHLSSYKDGIHCYGNYEVYHVHIGLMMSELSA